MPQIDQLEHDLNEAILAGNIMDAFEKYYADDVVMQENSDAPTAGKDANRKRELDFVASIAEFHGAKLDNTAVNGDTAFSQWSLDLSFKNGHRAQYTQVAVRQWKGGQVAHERFFYTH